MKKGVYISGNEALSNFGAKKLISDVWSANWGLKKEQYNQR